MEYWNSQTTPPRARVADWKVALADYALALERIWALLWPGLGWFGLFVALSLFGVWDILPGWLHAIGLLALGVLCAREGLRFTNRFTWPTREESLARLERDSHLHPQSLRQMEDSPAYQDAAALTLWRAYQKRLARQLKGVRVGAPFLSLARFDRYALRVLLIIVIFIGAVSAGRDVPERLMAGLIPDFGGAPKDIALNIWVTPPEYTGRPPLLLSRGEEDGKTIYVPEGSKLNATLDGGWRTPWARLGDEKVTFEETTKRSYQLDAILTEGEGLDIGQGATLHRRWPIKIVGDGAPIVVFPDVPEETRGHSLKITYEAYDDYGVDDLTLGIFGPAGLFGARQDIALTPPHTRDGKAGHGVTYQDLTASQWAGEEVDMMLSARDGVGQVGRTLPLTVTLPERNFTHPVARALIDIRKELFRNPEQRKQPARYLDAIARLPDQYDGSLMVYTGLRAARWRLAHDQGLDGVRGVTGILWDVALELEEGRLGAAQRALRDAMSDLMSALQQGDENTFSQMMDQLRQKMQDMLRAQMEAMQNGQQNQAQSQPQPNGQNHLITPSMLDRMMQQIEDMAAAGDMEGAMDMLAQMQAMMENMQTPEPMSEEDMQRAMAASQALQGLESLMDMQRQLMNDTVRQSLGQPPRQGQSGQRGQQGEQGQGQQGQQGQGWQGLAQQQQGLGDGLDGIGKTLGDAGLPTPGALDRAKRAMERAQQGLSQGDGVPSIRAQGEALDALQQARNAMGEALDEAMQQMQAAGTRQDPLGRPNTQGLTNQDVTIPTEADYLRVREIREELQRRLSDPNRPAEERSYIRRLLERFR